MKYFTNQSLTEEISGDTLDLGIVDAGESRKYTIWVLNNEGTLIKNLKFSIDHSEIKIVKMPEIMPIDDRQEIIFTWSPEITLKEGLKVSLEMTGKALWG